jgi:hypothetical protein
MTYAVIKQAVLAIKSVAGGGLGGYHGKTESAVGILRISIRRQ